MLPGHAYASRLLAAVAQGTVFPFPAPAPAPAAVAAVSGAPLVPKLTWLYIRDEAKEFALWKEGKNCKNNGAKTFITQMQKPYNNVALSRWSTWIGQVESSGRMLLNCRA